MFTFKHAKVYRGGVTASHVNLETSTVWATPEADGSVSLSTVIASKGGGDTFVKVALTAGDVEQLVVELIRVGGLAELGRLFRAAERGTEAIRSEAGREFYAMSASAETEADKLKTHASKLMQRGPFEDGYKVLSGAMALQGSVERAKSLGEDLGLVVEPRKKKPASRKS